MRKIFISFLALALGFSVEGWSQNNTSKFWQETAAGSYTLPETAVREFEPDTYLTYTLDYNGLLSELSKAPMEFTTAGNNQPLRVAFPMADGSIQTFALNESKLVSDRVYNKFPDIRSYTGYSLKDPATKIKITVSAYWGFKGTIRKADRGIDYIERVARGNHNYYMVYDRRAFPAKYYRPDLQQEPDFVELPAGANDTHDHDAPATAQPVVPQERDAQAITPVGLKVYRFACATTGEFAQDHGGTTASVLAAMVNYVGQLNAIYEPELAIRLILIDNVESILFLDPATDPYTGDLVPGWRSQNPEAMIQTIGFDSYDIGHLFARYKTGPILGQASLSSCCTDFKGLACSGGNLPYGDAFLNTIGHEIGHQWSAGHTFNSCEGNEGALSVSSACEPGSGTTIMSYAGACGPDNISGGTLGLYYNACSLSEIRQFIQQEAGSTCGEIVTAMNSAPQVTILTPEGLTIPISTPFVLKSDAIDPDGDPLTYCWEQADLGPSVPLGQAQVNSPLFRSYPPSPNSDRVFPRLQAIAQNQNNPAELLPTYTRNMRFSVTVRDEKMGGGGVTLDTILVKVSASAGPFRVTYPTANSIAWHPGEYQTVTWSVANSNLSPVNCQKVNIKMSKDGGLTYPITLAQNTANDGEACVLVPAEIGAANRIMVEAADNIFFDISNNNFRIEAPAAPGFAICTAETEYTVCNPSGLALPVGSGAWGGFNEAVTYSVQDLPVGATVSFSQNGAPAGDDVVANFDFAGTPEGTYEVLLIANTASTSDSVSLKLTVVSNNFAGLTLTTPVDGAPGVSQSPILRWTAVADANRYQVQVASNPAFSAGTIHLDNAAVTADSLLANANLEKGTLYYWRVRPANECGSGDWVGPFVFATQVDACSTYVATDVPKNISSSNTNPVESQIVVLANGSISDVNVKKVGIFHDAFSQLEVRLIGPAGGNGVRLFSNRCGFSSITMDAGFDDAASITTFPCPPNGGVSIRPSQMLSAFNGQSSAGTWKLWVKDNETGSGGSVGAFELEICSGVSLNPPFIVNNNPLALPSGTNTTIPTNLLKSDDNDNTAAELRYYLLATPVNGQLLLEGFGYLSAGDYFTQAQIDQNQVRYYDWGLQQGGDSFRFAVTDQEGGLVVGTFVISPIVGINDLNQRIAFSLAPNPARETVRLDFGDGLTSDADVQLFNAAGQLVRSFVMGAGIASRVVSVADLPAGLYTVAVRTAEGTAVRKLMVE